MKRSAGINPGLALLLERSVNPEIDYGFVMDTLKNYADPRNKLKRLVDSGALIRLKPGLYVISQKLSQKDYCFELIANLLYGPSYVSLEWACQYYRLIPERVETVTSVTAKRPQQYETELRHFTFDHVHPDLYPVGITQQPFSSGRVALIATPEKAVSDLLVVRRGRCSSLKSMKEILFDDLRFEQEDLITFDLERLERIYRAYSHSAIHYLIEVIKQENEK